MSNYEDLRGAAANEEIILDGTHAAPGFYHQR